MRKTLLALMAVTSFVAINSATASARDPDYQYCIKGREWLSPVGDCSFTSLKQCQASASGRLATCDINPFFGRDRMTDNRHRRRTSMY
jgi:hypothetical protein